MAGFDEVASAARMRDFVERVATKVVDKKRPDIQIGTVHHFDAVRQFAWILYRGESEEDLVRVRVALNMLPTKTIESHGEDADVVRVAGRPGSYYLADYVRGTPRLATAGGGGNLSMDFAFAVASTEWVMVHNFESPVDVITFDTNGDELIGDATYPDDNTVVVNWYYPTAGTARVHT